MYNLLIADDEELERRTIKSIIVKNFENIFSIYEAKNGREAIEIAERVKPEVFIMDIKMPGINGMEAIKEIRKTNNEGYFIILTAYDYFDYAKEAIEYDVKEYMLKPFKRNEFISKLETAIKSVENQKQKRKEEILLKEKIYTLIPMMENELCYSIINDNLHSVDYITHLQYLKIKFNLGYSMIIRINNFNSHKDKNNVKSLINDYLKEHLRRQNNAITNCIFTEDIIVFMECDKKDVGKDYNLEIGNTARKLVDNVNEKFNVQAFVGVGGVYEGIEKLSISFREALTAVDSANETEFIKFFRDLGGFKINVEEEDSEKLVSDNYYDGKNIISKSIEYINNNFTKDIMLEEVSNYVNVSSFYFSKLFKEYTGKNYVDYITDLRIEIAKKKLRVGNASIKEICYEVGYNDPNYFSRVFKKIEGISPTEYKMKFIDKDI